MDPNAWALNLVRPNEMSEVSIGDITFQKTSESTVKYPTKKKLIMHTTMNKVEHCGAYGRGIELQAVESRNEEEEP